MGIVSSLVLLHNQINGAKYGGIAFSSLLESKPFTTNELYPILKTALEKDKEYRIKKLSEDNIELVEIVDEEVENEWDTFHISKVGKNDVSIKCNYLNDKLHFYLSHYAVLGHEVHIEWNGLHPFYNPENFSNYKEGHYHYACIVPQNELFMYVNDIMENFKGYNDYWELTLFHSILGLRLNNHHNTIYEDENAPENELFGITIIEPAQSIKTIHKANSESDNNYYFQKLRANEVMEIIDDLIKELELTDSGMDYFLTAFNPAVQSYYKITASIKDIDIQKVVESFEGNNICIKGMKVKLLKEETEKGNIILRWIHKQKLIGHSKVIKNQDILEGHVYLGKMYNDKLFETIQRTIAQNFCPCYIGSEDYPITFYYKSDKEKAFLEEYYNSIKDKGWHEYKDYWLSGFIKV
jgi:hypothetical protein